MDTYLAIASRRDQRRYRPEPLSDDVVGRILDAGRLAGSASNRQPWTFVVPEGRSRVEAVAKTVYVPDNVLGAGLVVAVVANGMGLLDKSAAVVYMVTGGVLLLAASVDALSRRRAAASGRA